MTETLRLDPSVDPEFCAICRKLPILHLRMEIEIDGQRHEVSVCRDCLAEHAPEALAAIEADALKGIALEGEGPGHARDPARPPKST